MIDVIQSERGSKRQRAFFYHSFGKIVKPLWESKPISMMGLKTESLGRYKLLLWKLAKPKKENIFSVWLINSLKLSVGANYELVCFEIRT